MTPLEFKTNLKRHFKTFNAAAKYLGISRRAIFYYLSGHTRVPKSIEIILHFLEKTKPLPISETPDSAQELEE